MTPRVTVYKGQTLTLPATRLDDAGMGRTLVGTVVTAWLGTDQFALPVDVVVTDAAKGEYVFSRAVAGTATWPVGVWALYVQYAEGAEVTPELACLLDVRVAT